MYTLRIKIDDDLQKTKEGQIIVNELENYYKQYETKHAGDSGIDLLIPEDVNIPAFGIKSIDHHIKCEMLDKDGQNVSYYLYPRSSISKTPLMMANSIGIIDAGYRGNIIAKTRYIPEDVIIFPSYLVDSKTGITMVCYTSGGEVDRQMVSVKGSELYYLVGKNSKLFQICAPDLSKVKVEVMTDLTATSRGTGGFGSTDNKI